MKQIYIDLETTGLFEWKNGVWQIAGSVYENDKLKESFNFVTQPFANDEWDTVALSMCPIAIEDFSLEATPEKTFADFKEVLGRHINPFNKKDKFHIYAYNAQFDEKFLRKFFYKSGDKFFGSWFWKPTIDIMALAGEFLKEQRPEMENFKQGTVAKQLGIEVDESKLHDALYDIQLSREIYKKVTHG